MISAVKSYPATEGVAPVLSIPNPEPETDPGATNRVEASNPISAFFSWPSTDGANPIIEPLITAAVLQTVDRWKPQYPDSIWRPSVHASRIPATPTWSNFVPFDEESFPWTPYVPPPVFRRWSVAPYMAPTRTNTPFAVPLTPALWDAVFPDVLPRRKSSISAISPASFFISQDIGQIIPDIASWQGEYPDFARDYEPIHYRIPAFTLGLPDANVRPFEMGWYPAYADFARTYSPIHHLAPYLHEYELMSPNLTMEVSSWLPTIPDFARGRPITHHMAPTLVWHTITGPDVKKPGGTNQFRDTRRR